MRTWAPEQIATLRRMAQTHSAAQIAVAIGRTREAVYDKAKLLGISVAKQGAAHHSAKHPRATLEAVFELRAEGKSAREIAAQLAISPNTVKGYLGYQTRWRELMDIEQERT